MDAFYAAVEQRDNPVLRGRPVLVGGRGRRGVVTTASYEARVFGCRSAMPTARALRLCPGAIVVPMRMQAYIAESRRIREILETFSPDIEPVSIDEAFVDVSGVRAWSGLGGGERAARKIRQLIRDRTGLTASVGVSVNKFLAKVASDLDKPDGLTVIRADEAAARLAPMPVGVIWGIGAVASQRLAARGVRVVADLLAADPAVLAADFGAETVAHWRRLCVGDDSRAVQPARVNKSIGKERTFGDDIADPARLRAILLDQVEQAAQSLRSDGLFCGTVVVKLRRPDFRTFTRSRTLETPTDHTAELHEAAREILDRFMAERPGPLRLLGVSLQGLTDHAQSRLFESPARARSGSIDSVSDAIAARFGRRAIRRAGGMDQTDRARRIDGS